MGAVPLRAQTSCVGEPDRGKSESRGAGFAYSLRDVAPGTRVRILKPRDREPAVLISSGVLSCRRCIASALRIGLLGRCATAGLPVSGLARCCLLICCGALRARSCWVAMLLTVGGPGPVWLRPCEWARAGERPLCIQVVAGIASGLRVRARTQPGPIRAVLVRAASVDVCVLTRLGVSSIITFRYRPLDIDSRCFPDKVGGSHQYTL